MNIVKAISNGNVVHLKTYKIVRELYMYQKYSLNGYKTLYSRLNESQRSIEKSTISTALLLNPNDIPSQHNNNLY